MTTTTNDLTPAQLLASEPVFKRGVKSRFQQTADRTIKYTWTVGEADDIFGEPGTVLAVLVVHHYNKTLSATLWRHMERDNMIGCAFDGSNGRRIVSEPAPRYSAAKLQPFAEHALSILRTVFADDPQVLGYFDLTVLKP